MEFTRLEKVHAWVIFVISFILLVLHTAYSILFTVDAISVSILAMIMVLPYLKYVQKISIQGTSVELEKDIKETSKEVKDVVNEKQVEKAKDVNQQFNDFVKYIESILSIDPDVAIMKLRTELELAIKQVYQKSKQIPKKRGASTINSMVAALYQHKVIDENAGRVTLEITSIANRIVHGEHINKEIELDVINTFLRLIAYYYNALYALENLSKTKS